MHRSDTLVGRAGDSIDAPNQRFGRIVVEFAMGILKRRRLKVVPIRGVLRYQRVTDAEQLTQGLQIEDVTFEPDFPRHKPNLAGIAPVPPAATAGQACAIGPPLAPAAANGSNRTALGCPLSTVINPLTCLNDLY
jgi:hypothetical protein